MAAGKYVLHCGIIKREIYTPKGNLRIILFTPGFTKVNLMATSSPELIIEDHCFR
jgi:hypothetical protein